MKNLFLTLLCVSYLFALEQKNVLQAVPYVDVQKFSGLWYEIARTYNDYQERCVASSVEYILKNQKEYEIHNRCFDTHIGGRLIEYKGSAESSNDDTNMSKIDMTYFWIFTKRYEVFFLEEDYSSAVVADRKLEQLWILSRSPTIDENALQKIHAVLENVMDLKRLIYTSQDALGRYK